MGKAIPLIQAALILLGLVGVTLASSIGISYQRFQRQGFSQRFANSWQGVQDLQVSGFGKLEYRNFNKVIQFRSQQEIRLREPQPIQTLPPEIALKIWTPQPHTCQDLIRQGGSQKILFRRRVNNSDKPNGVLFVRRLDTNQYCYQEWDYI